MPTKEIAQKIGISEEEVVKIKRQIEDVDLTIVQTKNQKKVSLKLRYIYQRHYKKIKI